MSSVLGTDSLFVSPVTPVDGVVDFVRRRGADRFGEGILRGNWVERNWHKEKTLWEQGTPGPGLGSMLAGERGVILEIAAGPGGGNLPSILFHNSQATVIVNDFSRLVLAEWKRVLSLDKAGDNVLFAAFDARKMPLKSASMDVVSTLGGFGNIAGQARAIREAVRVLRPGGRLLMIDVEPLNEDWRRLPDSVRRKWQSSCPALGSGFTKLLWRCGLIVQQRAVIGRKVFDDADDGELARTAIEHGVHLRADVAVFEAIKPAS